MTERNYSLDALRVIMMLLGLVVHAGIVYTALDVFISPIHDTDKSITYDYAILFIHAFRMPVFFVLSGFFAALLYSKKELKTVFWSRMNRLVFPFIVSMILVVPLVKIMILHFAAGMTWTEVFGLVKSLEIYSNLITGHLWFLYYLIIIYVICHVLNYFKFKFLAYIQVFFRKIIYPGSGKSYMTIIAFTLISSCFIIPQGTGMIDTSLSLIPDPLILFNYLVYFGFGYLLYNFQQQLREIFSPWKIYLAGGIILSVVYFYLFCNALENPSVLTTGLASFTCALLSWFMIFGLMGLFLFKLNYESKIMFFLSRSSYWIYIMHLPLTVFLSGYFLSFEQVHLVKFVLIILLTFSILILLYKVFVEKTFIGVFLNGRSKKN